MYRRGTRRVYFLKIRRLRQTRTPGIYDLRSYILQPFAIRKGYPYCSKADNGGRERGGQNRPGLPVGAYRTDLPACSLGFGVGYGHRSVSTFSSTGRLLVLKLRKTGYIGKDLEGA